MSVHLRDYQIRDVEALREAIRNGHRQVLYQLPVGGGKTVVMSEIMRGARDKGSRVLFLAHRRELIWQVEEKLKRLGIYPTVIMGNVKNLGLDKKVVVSTIQSALSPRHAEKIGEPDLIVIDEAHRAMAPSYRKLVSAFPNAVLLGMTATPIRMDGKGLGYLFKYLHTGPTIPQLIEQNYLVPPRYYAPYIPDLRGVRVRNGDYVERDLEKVMDTPAIIGNIQEWWGRLASDRRTIVFASTVAHSIHIAHVFREAGVAAAHVDGTTPTQDRDQIIADFRQGRLQMLVNVDIATEGTDIPETSAIVIARPTKSLTRWIQMIGRGLRPAPGKEDCRVIDHTGTVYKLRFVEEWNEWSLDDFFKERQAERTASTEPKEKTTTCPHCKAVLTRADIVITPIGVFCPECAEPLPKRYGRRLEYREGELVEVHNPYRQDPPDPATLLRRRQEYYAELLYIQRENGYQPGWVAHRFRARFGDWPPFEWRYSIQPRFPTKATAYLLKKDVQKRLFN